MLSKKISFFQPSWEGWSIEVTLPQDWGTIKDEQKLMLASDNWLISFFATSPAFQLFICVEGEEGEHWLSKREIIFTNPPFQAKKILITITEDDPPRLLFGTKGESGFFVISPQSIQPGEKYEVRDGVLIPLAPSEVVGG